MMTKLARSWRGPIIILTILLFVLIFASADQTPTLSAIGKQNVESSQQSNDESTTGNETDISAGNETMANVTTTMEPTLAPVLPEADAQEEEHKSSMAIFFILFVIMISILLVHMLLVNHLHFIPESLAIVILGTVLGGIVKWSDYKDTFLEAEAFSPNAFFIVLLPPIIFEGGYNLHKGNFFANIGSILVFAVFGTAISTLIVGFGVYILGQAGLVFELRAIDAFAFGALISAVDPVATLAIFQALAVDPLLYMLVFGESMLNDAVAIVLATTILSIGSMEDSGDSSSLMIAINACVSFIKLFVMSALLGFFSGVVSAFVLKHVDLRRTPSLEFALLLVFAYLPYGLAEGLHLSGIMAILFCGVCMSHYTHFNLSPMTQITMQQTFRTLAFCCETCVFAYLGLALFTFPLVFEPSLIIWSIVLCLIGRAANIFPLSFICNRYREHKITKKMQFVMWFSGLRGAIAFALTLYMSWTNVSGNKETKYVMIANTLSVVIFTTMVLGGATMPLLHILNDWFSEDSTDADDGHSESTALRRRKRKRSARRRTQARGKTTLSDGGGRQNVSMSKTKEMNVVLETFSHSDYTTTEAESGGGRRRPITDEVDNNPAVVIDSAHYEFTSRVLKFDELYMRPFLVRKFTHQEKKESAMKLTDMAMQWYRAAEQETDSADEASNADMNRQAHDNAVMMNTSHSTTTLHAVSEVPERIPPPPQVRKSTSTQAIIKIDSSSEDEMTKAQRSADPWAK